MSRLLKLHEQGQSFWMDFLSREFVTSGQLLNWIEKDGLRGITSNPTIFHKSISKGSAYDKEIESGDREKKSSEDIFDRLSINDIQLAAEAFLPFYDAERKQDGFVSLEVNPYFALDAQKTVEEARRLFTLANRPNVMIKIPGTEVGLKAIEDATFDGVNVNITLLFSVERYKKVIEAYWNGLRRRLKKNQPIHHIASVASFFVSRVDRKIDPLLKERPALEAKGLLHKSAVSNAKSAYDVYRNSINTPEWKELARQGARPQRLLWGSTSTKDKQLSDVYYVDALIGADTVNTMPVKTAEAFRDHGTIAPTLEEDIALAKQRIDQLRLVGIDIEQKADELLDEGIEAFQNSYDEILKTIGDKRDALVSRPK